MGQGRAGASRRGKVPPETGPPGPFEPSQASKGGRSQLYLTHCDPLLPCQPGTRFCRSSTALACSMSQESQALTSSSWTQGFSLAFFLYPCSSYWCWHKLTGPTHGCLPPVDFPLRATQQVWLPRVLVNMELVVSERADECWERGWGAGDKENCYLIC